MTCPRSHRTLIDGGARAQTQASCVQSRCSQLYCPKGLLAGAEKDQLYLPGTTLHPGIVLTLVTQSGSREFSFIRCLSIFDVLVLLEGDWRGALKEEQTSLVPW